MELNKVELRAAAARLLYNDSRDSADYHMLVDYIDNSAPVNSEISSSDDAAEAKDGMFLTNLIAQICDYAVAHHLSPDDTIKTVSDNLASILKISTFEGWGRNRV